MHLTAPYALTTLWASAIGAAIPATIAGAVAVYASWLGRKRAEQDRRRDLYSEAYKLALAWCEGVYRVRRRPPDGSGDRDLVERFHKLQEDIAYYEGWLWAENEELGAAYQTFLKQVMAECELLLQDAWTRPGREPTEPTPPDEKHPDLKAAKKQFLDVVNRELKPWWKKLD